ncbi:MAG TPA: thiol reductant ABC exporter subunit CydD [Candidatus Limnocylindrales bacterium]|nr:thiol reductant ABC exporter subunit CydD [Candidatus Limnocylindrales bacterium]
MSVAASLGAVIVTIIAAALMAAAIAGTVEGTRGAAQVGALLVVLSGVVVVRSVSLGAAEATAGRAGIRLAADLRAELSAHLLALGPARAAPDTTGALATTLVGGLEAIEAWARSYRPASWLAVAAPLLVLVVVAVVDPLSALVLLVTGPVLVLLLGLIGSRVAPATAAREREQRWMQGYFADMLRGLATLRAFGRSREQAEQIRAIGLRHGESTMAVLRTAFQTSLVLEWGAAVAMALVAVELSLRLMAGGIGFEPTLAVLIIAPEFFVPLRRLAAQYHEGAAGHEAAIRVLEVLDREPAPPSPAPRAAGATAVLEDPLGDVVVEDVAVTYRGRAVPALAAVDLVLPAGRRIAVVGPSGAGKSTLVALLLRFLEPDAGRILAGGADIRTLDAAAWRAGIASLPQAPHLFHGSVADNIRLGRPDASLDEVVAAARDADANGFIATLPMGYDTPLGEDGARLSGGQRQRIGLARTFLRASGARLVVLDEPTAHLDPDAEAHVAESIAALAGPRTVVVVSHRPALVAGAEVVIELARGRVVR